MRAFKWPFFSVLVSLSCFAQTPTTEVQTRIANDYALFDEVKEIKISSATNLPGIVGSKLQLSVVGDLSARDCSYSGFAIFLQPKQSQGMNRENYNVTVQPIYQNQSVELSFRPCEDIAMGIVPFKTTIELMIHEWLGWQNFQWIYTFNGTGGVKLKHIRVTYAPATGWKLEEI